MPSLVRDSSTDSFLFLLVDSRRMLVQWLYFFLLLWSFSKASTDSNESAEMQKKKTEIAYPTMAPNSKFLNPHVDDDTNLQSAIAAFTDDSKTPEDDKKRTSDILQKLSENWNLKTLSREAKSLDDWRIVKFLNTLFSRNKNYKLKTV